MQAAVASSLINTSAAGPRAVPQMTAPPAWSGSPDYGHLTLAAALGYLDFRHEGRWRAGHPNLVAWLDRFAKAVPAFEETRPTA